MTALTPPLFYDAQGKVKSSQLFYGYAMLRNVPGAPSDTLQIYFIHQDPNLAPTTIGDLGPYLIFATYVAHDRSALYKTQTLGVYSETSDPTNEFGIVWLGGQVGNSVCQVPNQTPITVFVKDIFTAIAVNENP